MNPADIFVGSLAVVLGLVSLLGALFEWQAVLARGRRFETHLGRGGLRFAFTVIGLVLIAWGVAIFVGWSLWERNGPATRAQVSMVRP